MYTYYQEIQSEEHHLSATDIANHYEVFTRKGQPYSRLVFRLCEVAEREAGALPIYLKVDNRQARVFRHVHYFDAIQKINAIRNEAAEKKFHYIKLDGQGYYFI